MRHFCRNHFSNEEPVSCCPYRGVVRDYVNYDLARLHFSYDENRYCFRLDPCEGQGGSLYVETGYIELSLVYYSLDRTLPTPTTHNLLLSLARRMSLTVHRVVIDDFIAASRTFAAKMVLTGDKVIQFECRVSDGVALAMISGCGIYVARTVEQEYYSIILPGQSNS